MGDLVRLASVIALFGTAASFLFALLSHLIRRRRESSFDPDTLEKSGIESLRPKTVNNKVASARLSHLMMRDEGPTLSELMTRDEGPTLSQLMTRDEDSMIPHLMMHNADYPLGVMDFSLRQPDF